MIRVTVYIAAAARAKLHPYAKTLNDAYGTARKERWRKELQEDWKHTDDAGWPK